MKIGDVVRLNDAAVSRYFFMGAALKRPDDGIVLCGKMFSSDCVTTIRAVFVEKVSITSFEYHTGKFVDAKDLESIYVSY